MTVMGRRIRSGFISFLVISTGLAFASCTSEEAEDTSANVTQEAPEESVDIPEDTLAGEQSQRVVELLNAEEDTTTEDLEEHLHSSVTAEMSVEELVDLFNENLRPAQPFTVTNYEGGERQAVTTVTSQVSDPLDVSVSVDNNGLITGLFFTPAESEG